MLTENFVKLLSDLNNYVETDETISVDMKVGNKGKIKYLSINIEKEEFECVSFDNIVVPEETVDVSTNTEQVQTTEVPNTVLEVVQPDALVTNEYIELDGHDINQEVPEPESSVAQAELDSVPTETPAELVNAPSDTQETVAPLNGDINSLSPDADAKTPLESTYIAPVVSEGGAETPNN